MSVSPGYTYRKDPNELLVREMDWSDFLGSAEIASSVWTITGSDAVLTQDNDSTVAGNQQTRVRLKVGTLGVTYQVSNRIVTNETPAQTVERSFFVAVRNL